MQFWVPPPPLHPPFLVSAAVVCVWFRCLVSGSWLLAVVLVVGVGFWRWFLVSVFGFWLLVLVSGFWFIVLVPGFCFRCWVSSSGSGVVRWCLLWFLVLVVGFRFPVSG